MEISAPERLNLRDIIAELQDNALSLLDHLTPILLGAVIIPIFAVFMIFSWLAEVTIL